MLCLLCPLHTDKFTSVQIVFFFFPYFSSWINLSLILNLNSVKERQFKAALPLLLLDKSSKRKLVKNCLNQAFLLGEDFPVSVEKCFFFLKILG